MPRQEIVQKLIRSGAIAVIRMGDSKKLMRVAEAILKGGVSAIEITMTTPNALKIIEEAAKELGEDAQIGVGSVLDAKTARSAIDAGATYVVSPIFKAEIVQTAHRHDLPGMPGAFSPTEILLAHEAGADGLVFFNRFYQPDLVKIFPADVVGMDFFKSVLAPIPQLRLMPTGGVTLTNAGDWLKAGACAVGVGSALLDKKAIAEEKYSVLTENARILKESIASARK